ncbi:hypothetical protein ACSQ67_019931 [Phaseolus vulgaris]
MSMDKEVVRDNETPRVLIPSSELQRTLNCDPCMVTEVEAEIGFVLPIQSIDMWGMVSVTLKRKKPLALVQFGKESENLSPVQGH